MDASAASGKGDLVGATRRIRQRVSFLNFGTQGTSTAAVVAHAVTHVHVTAVACRVDDPTSDRMDRDLVVFHLAIRRPTTIVQAGPGAEAEPGKRGAAEMRVGVITMSRAALHAPMTR